VPFRGPFPLWWTCLCAASWLFQPATATAQPGTSVRACDPPFHNQVFGSNLLSGRIDPRESPTEQTIANLNAELAKQPTPLGLLDLARCHYTIGKLAEAEQALRRALPLLENVAPLPEAIPDTWSKYPLAGRDVPKLQKTRDRAAALRYEAAEIGIRGVVVVDAVIDARGRVRDARIASSIPAHDNAALAAVKEWQFAPTVVAGTPVEVAAMLFLAFGNEVRTTDNIDVARFHATRGQPDAKEWATRALELVQAEAKAWAANPGADLKEQIVEPLKIKNVPPTYPAIARNAKVQGLIIIEALINADGSVHYARVIKGPLLLREAALIAVRQWTYTPALVGGTPVPLIMTLTVNFTLN
jgi:TonB family protein